MYNDSHLFPSSGGWNTKQEQGARRFSVWWSPASGSHMAIFLLCPHVAGMSEGALWVSFMRALISFMRAVLASPDYFLKVPSPNTITSGTRLQHMNFRGHKHSVYSTNALPRPFSSEEPGAAAQIWNMATKEGPFYPRALPGVSWGHHWGYIKAQLFPFPNLDSPPLPPIGVDSKGTP